MKRLVVFLLLAALLAVFVCALLHANHSPTLKPEIAVPVSSTSQGNGQALFPGLDPTMVTAVSITTPQSAFDLRRSDSRLVSINGHRGDEEVFSTMLTHIAAMDFTEIPPFPAPETPLLTLVVHQRGETYTAAFYTDENKAEHARIISSRESVPVYGVTDGWYVGTLMLACEGTRIQDASGREIPAE